ncbi:hypothetical protein DICPUDRAFT_80940 [Dictyostelium purpureum]|uniref:Cytochrome P450 family protein n=1 Tax=Dictyostelium purpureum TaxID=5786 RepID=F0ZS03_DICPU|nr:uncharacterized protein DICPUDRAFT_80940 [Dictyostelium purpureum]EGC33286.1 hypothetical protein DICPUDRAFT_80940 [Dictyostelium purpureum]|eukprot:XP_003290187.1 hypothetical protein DICPUDRAFT_80940 [Dictyostelium purpureum]
MFIGIINTVFLTLGFLITILFIKDLVYEDRKTKINKLIPGPRAVPIFGNLLHVNKNDIPTSFDELYKKYGPVFRLKLGNIETVVISGSKTLDESFIKNKLATQHRFIRNSRFFLKDRDIMFSNGDLNLVLRTTFMSEITTRKLNNGRLDANKFALQMINKIYKGDDTILENFPKYVKETGIKIMINFIFGTEENEELNTKFIDTVARLFKNGGLFLYSDFIPALLPYDLLFLGYKDMVRDYLFLRDYSNKIINAYEEKLKNNQNSANEDQDSIKKPIMEHYYDRYLEGKIGYESVAFASVDLLVAGLDSTSNTVSFLVAALINNPELQDKIYEEVKDASDDISFADISKYPYVVAVMNEAYRYVSIVALSEPYIASEDFEVDGYTVAKGTQIIKNLRSVHISEEGNWEDPLKFNPDRFLASPPSLNQKLLYHFGIGKRICPGKSFAECVFFTIIVLLFKNYKFVNPNPSVPIDETQIVALAMQCKEYNTIVQKR